MVRIVCKIASLSDTEIRQIKPFLSTKTKRKRSEIVKRKGKQKKQRTYPKGPAWTREEDEKLLRLIQQHGTKFESFISLMPGRSIGALKSRWHIRLQAIARAREKKMKKTNTKANTERPSKEVIKKKNGVEKLKNKTLFGKSTSVKIKRHAYVSDAQPGKSKKIQ